MEGFAWILREILTMYATGTKSVRIYDKHNDSQCLSIDKFCISGGKRSQPWKPLFEEGVHIDFAHRTFRLDSEAKIKAHVHCVIIGFSMSGAKEKVIYTDNRTQVVNNINGYLVDAPDVFVEPRNKPLCDVPSIGIGNKPIDGGFYLFDRDGGIS